MGLAWAARQLDFLCVPEGARWYRASPDAANENKTAPYSGPSNVNKYSGSYNGEHHLTVIHCTSSQLSARCTTLTF